MLTFSKKEYMQLLTKRNAKNRITQEFQLIGLEIATLLRDLPHKALYIKYAKEYGSDRMLALAKDVKDRRGIENPAGYFMTLVEEMRKRSPIRKK